MKASPKTTTGHAARAVPTPVLVPLLLSLALCLSVVFTPTPTPVPSHTRIRTHTRPCSRTLTRQAHLRRDNGLWAG